MSIGALLRFMFVASWAIFLITHIVNHAAPGWGLNERNAFATALAQNLGRTYVYNLQRPTANAHLQKFGECTTSFLRIESGFELETTLHIDDLANIAPGIGLLPMLKEASTRQLHVRFTEVLNNERQLIAIRGSGNLLGLEAEGSGVVTESGLKGTYLLGEGTETPFTLSNITPEIANGNDLASTLPPGLKPGDKFTTQLLSPNLSTFSLSPVTAIYTVLPKEDIFTVAGRQNVLRVQMQVDNRDAATLWCDDNGTVFRSKQKDGTELSLITIREIGGDIIWPQALVTKP